VETQTKLLLLRINFRIVHNDNIAAGGADAEALRSLATAAKGCVLDLRRPSEDPRHSNPANLQIVYSRAVSG